MKRRWMLAISLAALATLACDKQYETRFSVALPATGAPKADQAAEELLSHLSKQFTLRCDKPETWTVPPNSSEKPEVHRECTNLSDYTHIKMVTSGDELTVEIDKLGGFEEPEGFREVRLAIQNYLKQAVPGATVTIE